MITKVDAGFLFPSAVVYTATFVAEKYIMDCTELRICRRMNLGAWCFAAGYVISRGVQELSPRVPLCAKLSCTFSKLCSRKCLMITILGATALMTVTFMICNQVS